MNLNKKICFASALLFSVATAFADDQETIVKEQKTLLEKLDSLNAAVLGIKFNGRVKAGGLNSMASSDQFSKTSGTQENQAYTDANLVLTAHPSSETEIHLEMRLHKDWQSAYEETNNPVLGHWFSYDGLILNKHVDFNLGYMRVGWTPLTLWTPQPNLIQEPEVFAANRVEAMSWRNLDTTSRRLLQGVNVNFNSFEVGPVDNIHAQVTGARLRNISKKNDQTFFDFDWSDRYQFGGRVDADLFGAHLGANYIDVFDRKLSTDAHDIVIHDNGTSDTIYLEDNSVFSGQLGWDSKKMLSSLPVSFGFNAEYAMAWWEAQKRYISKTTGTNYMLKLDTVPDANGSKQAVFYVKTTTTNGTETVKEKFDDFSGSSFYVEPYVKGDFSQLHVDVNGMYLMNDKEFWSELASAPAFEGNAVIMNANAVYANETYGSLVSALGASSLENLYFSVYNSNPLNRTNILTAGYANVLSSENDYSENAWTNSRVYNNFKNMHFFRNGYAADTKKLLEQGEALALMDPSLNLALPYGLATPDRKGFSASLNLSWAEAVEVSGQFSKFSQDAIDNEFTEFGGGLGIDVARLVGLDAGSYLSKIKLQGSYAHGEESEWYKRSSDRIMAGLTVDIWGPIGIWGGYQQVTKEYGNPLNLGFAGLKKAEESVVLAGPRFRIAPNSYISVQYALLTDKVSFDAYGLSADGALSVTADELSIDKSAILADVTVNF